MSKRVLVVEDEDDVRELIAERLMAQQYEVITASDGSVGLEKARKEHPDLVILDLMLPNLNGYEICTILKQDSNYKHIPVIMLTARAGEKDKTIGNECGADVYLTKPYESKELIQHVSRLISNRVQENR